MVKLFLADSAAAFGAVFNFIPNLLPIFLRQKYGRPQQMQILLGSSDFLGIAIRSSRVFQVFGFLADVCFMRCFYAGCAPVPV